MDNINPCQWGKLVAESVKIGSVFLMCENIKKILKNYQKTIDKVIFMCYNSINEARKGGYYENLENNIEHTCDTIWSEK